MGDEVDFKSRKRHCWVCFGTEQDDDNNDVVWICPCQCKGTMKWVHEDCLQRWVDEKQKRTNSLFVSCSQCKTHYLLSFPPANLLIRLIEHYDQVLYGTSPFIAVSIVVGSIYWCCGSYGFMTIIQVMGYEDGSRFIDEADPMLLVIGLPIIPVALILSKLIKWEDFILRVWKQSAYKLPRPLSYFIEQPPARPRANCDQLLRGPGFSDPLGCTRLICGALLLPTVASLIGRFCFWRLPGPQWRRSLIGGLAFLLFKGAMKIYLRKSQYIRYSQRTIRDYRPKHIRRGGSDDRAGSTRGSPHATTSQELDGYFLEDTSTSNTSGAVTSTMLLPQGEIEEESIVRGIGGLNLSIQFHSQFIGGREISNNLPQ